MMAMKPAHRGARIAALTLLSAALLACALTASDASAQGSVANGLTVHRKAGSAHELGIVHRKASSAYEPGVVHGKGGLAYELGPLHRGERLAPATRRRTHERRRTLGSSRPRHRAHAARRRAHAAKRRRGHPHRLLVLVDLKHLRQRGAIDGEDMRSYRAIYLEALRSLRSLSGTRHAELAGVLGNVREIAAAKGLIASRLPALFLTVRRNREWWTKGSLLSYGERVSFPGSRLVWEYYPGQGVELQWLATFGEANGYYLSGHENGPLRQVLQEALSLATDRAGGIAWEYLFHFDGGSPPWTSGLSQGTALQAFSRAWSRLHEPQFLEAAESALHLFQTPPPEGVRISAPKALSGGEGIEYLEYSYAPEEHILNGFIQALTGIYDYTKLSGSQVGLRLFEEGDAAARAETPHYDTGAWSMYDQKTESDLGYHELLTEFLQNLCRRTKSGEPASGAEQSGPGSGEQSGSGSGEPAGNAGSTGGTSSATGGEPAAGESSGGEQPASGESSGAAQPAESGSSGAEQPGEGESSGGEQSGQEAQPTQIPGDEVYCTTAERFSSYLHTPPKIQLLSHRARRDARAGVMFSLSKVSNISMTIRRKGSGKIVWTNGATVEAGRPRLLWITPKHGGTFSLSATATDLAGNVEDASGTIRIKGRQRHRHRHAGHGKPTQGGHAGHGKAAQGGHAAPGTSTPGG